MGGGLTGRVPQHVGLPLCVVVGASFFLSGCSSTATDEPDSKPTIASLDDPEEVCLNGAQGTLRSDIDVERATVVPLAHVKKWVLEVPERDWETFSASLVDAPLTERVGVCVLTKKDGSRFTPEGATESFESVVTITRATGESTVVQLDTLDGNLLDTPTTFARYD